MHASTCVVLLLLTICWAKNPNCPSAKQNSFAFLSKEGKKFANQQDYKRALPCFLEAGKIKQTAANWLDIAASQDTLNLLDDALESFKKVLELDETQTLAQIGTASLLIEKKLHNEALPHAEAAVKLDPQNAEAHKILGSIYYELGQGRATIREFEAALKIDPESMPPSIFPVLGDLHAAAGGSDGIRNSVDYFKLAVYNFPDDIYLQLRLGLQSFKARNYESALKILKRVWTTEKDPWHPALKPTYFHALVNMWMKSCDWRYYDKMFTTLAELIQEDLEQGGKSEVYPLHALSYPFTPELTSAIISSSVVKLPIDVAPLWDQPPFRWEPVPGERLRIGYVSMDFRNHAMGRSIVDLFAFHDRSKFEIFAYFLNKDDDSWIYKKIAEDVEHVVDLSDMNDDESARRINQDHIHVLVNLFGHSGSIVEGNFIFALKPAPLAILHQGFVGEYGASDFIQYYTSDPIVVPPESRDKQSPQKILYMPDCYHFASAPERLLSSPVANEADTPMGGSETPLPAYSLNGFDFANAKQSPGSVDDILVRQFPDQLKGGNFLFCNFGVPSKIDPRVFDIWMRILSRVENSVLWLIRYSAVDGGMPADANLKKEAEKRGVDPNRVLFADKYPSDSHLRIKSACHMYLDTLEYNLHSVAAETLWSGVPGISWPQIRPASRVGASMLTAVDLPELVVNSASEYEEQAVKYGTNAVMYQELRQKLRENRDKTALFDHKKWASNFERGLQLIWDKHQEGLPLEDVFVQ